MPNGLVRVFTFLLALSCWTAVAAQPSGPDEIAKEDFFREGVAPVRKDPGYNLTVVYFMDYQCPSCRQYTPDVARALREDGKLRVIYRDTPILGPRSDAAARAAIASQFQGKHEPFHAALMVAPMPLDEPALQAAARKAGVDWKRLQADLAKRSDEIDRQILTNMMLSTATGISGTPAFIIGNRLSDGALTYKDFVAEIADARAELGVTSARPEAPAENLAATGNTQSASAPAAPMSVSQDAPLFKKSPASSASGAQPGDRPSNAGRPIAAWAAALGVLLAAWLGFLAWRRRRSRAPVL